ncbi:PTS transporter subunit IIC [Streptococcus pluranimalium]|uniref:PTS transporter subunit IIC n=1 Tax=Streptococcus hyovaginalis TaxID=149015 RepID=UPI00147842CF|nr:PTS sugar transporter subunit IIC [Streptococcus hyovaginalis]MDY3024252.1 PTS sugar transporter subunit IIC [Streptococcus hyovaginalis]MDY4510712.1 PTS sugar transporter subunit IIC [Streptococcus hyovaginalis]
MSFLKRKGVTLSAKSYLIDAMSAMAQGLFASLLVGTILSTIGQLTGLTLLADIGQFASSIKGAAMAMAVGYALQAPPLVLYSLLAVGQASDQLGGAGGPLAVYVISLIACEIGKLISKETKLDILITPLVTIISGSLLALWIAPTIGQVASSSGKLIMWATELQPFLMGSLIAIFMGMILTLPISSAAICAALGLTGLAGGAALAGCCAQMIGFATMSYRANGMAGFVAQGLGTSMLQVPNILKKPIIWLPTILTSAVTGPLATMFFKLEMNGPAISSGMGTSGLVGQIGVYTGWISDIAAGHKTAITSLDWIGLVTISFLLPAVLTGILSHICQKWHLYSDKDLRLDL